MSARGSPPSEGTTQIWRGPSFSCWKAICRPSGDQIGNCAAILVFTGAMALFRAGLAPEIVTLAFGAVIVGLGLAAALAAGPTPARSSYDQSLDPCSLTPGATEKSAPPGRSLPPKRKEASWPTCRSPWMRLGSSMG